MASVKFEYEGQVSSGGLKSWDNDSHKRVIVQLEDNDLTVDEMLEEFMNFMQAIGYKFELGDRLEVVNDFKTQKAEPQPQPIVDEGGAVVDVAAPTNW